MPGGSPLTEIEIRLFLANDYARVVNAMTIMCGSFFAAEDAVQEALARAWEAGARGVRIESPMGWISAVAANLLRDRFRRFLRERRARASLGGSHTRSAAPELVRVEEHADIRLALGRLPRRQREVAILYYYLDLDVEQIAAQLAVPKGTVKSALHRARASLAASLGGRDEDEEAPDVAHG